MGWLLRESGTWRGQVCIYRQDTFRSWRRGGYFSIHHSGWGKPQGAPTSSMVYATAYAHSAPWCCHFPCPSWAEVGLRERFPWESDGAKGTKQSLWEVGGLWVYVIRSLEVRRHPTYHKWGSELSVRCWLHCRAGACLGNNIYQHTPWPKSNTKVLAITDCFDIIE